MAGQETAAPAQKEENLTLKEIAEAWNIVAESANALASFLMQNGQATMEDCGEWSTACKTLAGLVQRALDTHNDLVNQELQTRNEAEKKLRKDLTEKGVEAVIGKEGAPSKIIKMNSKDNDKKSGATKTKRARTKPAKKKPNVRKKAAKKKK